MTQSYGSVPSPATNSSADANPRTPYPSEESESTSATRNDLSSSMTAIKRSVDTDLPFPGFARRRNPGTGSLASTGGINELYSSVIAMVGGPLWRLGLDHL